MALDLIYAVVGFVVGVVVTPYFRSYAMKKGENLATREDAKDILDQMKLVTAATKKIEAEISSGLWDKQKRWQMKREVLFEAARRVSVIDDGMLSLSVVMKEDYTQRKAWEIVKPADGEMANWLELKRDRMQLWTKASREFDESRAFVRIVCSKAASDSFSDLGGFINNVASQLTTDPNAYDVGRNDLFRKILIVQNAIRKELEVEPVG
jgi:hypothetical protein